jgi:hypothetical protein
VNELQQANEEFDQEFTRVAAENQQLAEMVEAQKSMT